MDMNKREIHNYMDRFSEEIKSDGFRTDLRDRFVAAWTLFSRIPLPGRWWPVVMPHGNRILSIAPAVGGSLGMITGAVVISADAIGFGELASVWMGVFFYAAAGWSLHLDGWGDLWDGIGSGKEGEELRLVMKDSRIGAYGVTGLILAFGLWTSMLSSVSRPEIFAACSVSAASGRFASCSAALRGSYPWEKGMAKGWVDTFTGYDLFTAVICLLIFMPFGPIKWFFSASAALLTGFGAAAWMNSRLGGVNGDVLGASAVAAEIVSLAVFSL